MRKYLALVAVLVFTVALGVAAPAVASSPPTPAPACSWTAWRWYTDDIATGGYSHFYGTVYYKVEICDGVKTRTRVGTFYVKQKITETAYEGIEHTILDARHIKNDNTPPDWIDPTDHSCTDVCEIKVIYDVQNIVAFDRGNQVTVFCRGCNAGGNGGETTVMYYIKKKIVCEGTFLAC